MEVDFDKMQKAINILMKNNGYFYCGECEDWIRYDVNYHNKNNH